MEAPAPTEGWTIVTRRRRPPHFLPSPHPPPTRTTALNPPSLTYAQAVLTTPPSPPNTSNRTHPQTKPHNPDTLLKYIKSPYCPTMLPYPPKPHYKEWWGRCFRCARMGHVAADCKAPRWNPMCETIPTARTTSPNPNPMPAPLPPTPQLNLPQTKRRRQEPSFEVFLALPEPVHDPPMPQNRPKKVSCYLSRDDHYFQALEKTLRGIVVQPPTDPMGKLSLDQVAESVAASGKVTSGQLQIARLPLGKFLALLPLDLNRDEVVMSIPRRVWEEGYKFSSYSPLSDTSISIPLFKAWVDITSVPIELNKETHIARAITHFGLYLGSIEPRLHGDCHSWSVFLATDDLASIPHVLELRVGGMIYTATVRPRRWIKGQIYQRADMPPTPSHYTQPPSPPGSPDVSPPKRPFSDSTWWDEDDILPMSLKALREICRDVPPSSLPPDLVACLAGSKQAIEANHAAYRRWENEFGRGRPLLKLPEPHQATPSRATPDPTQVAEVATPSAPRPTVQASSNPRGDNSTVHRTAVHTAPQTSAQADLALQVCHNNPPTVSTEGDVRYWSPQDLFPETCTILSPTDPTAVNAAMTKAKKIPMQNEGPIPNPPRRTTRSRIGKNPTKDTPLLSLEVQDFIEVPLQYAEGRELLTLIGAASIPIPPHILNPISTQAPHTQVGRPNKTKSKRKNQTSPTGCSQTDQPAHDLPPIDTAPPSRISYDGATQQAPSHQAHIPPTDPSLPQSHMSSLDGEDPTSTDAHNPRKVIDDPEANNPYGDRILHSGNEDSTPQT